MGVVTDLAERVEETTGVDATGAVEDADGPVEAVARYNVGGLAFAEGTVTGEREDWVARGGVRDVLDTAVDYDGTWGGEEDSVDVWGPAAWGTEGSIADVLVNQQGEEPSTAEAKTTLLLYVVLAGVALYLLAPLLRLFTAVVDE